MECENIFENLDITLTEDYSDLEGPVCIEMIRDLMQRDDFNLQVSVKINEKLLEICETLNSIEEVVEESLGYYDYNLNDFVI